MPRQVSLVDYQPKPKNDAYTVLLSISLVAMIAACLLLWFDLKSYPKLMPDPADSARRPTPTAPSAVEQPAPAPVNPAPAPAPTDKPM